MEFLLLAAAVGGALLQPEYPTFALTPEQEGRRYSAEFQACIDRAAGSDSLVGLCLDEEFERQDAHLNAAYRSAMARLPDRTVRERLRLQQRAWLRTRQRACEAPAQRRNEVQGTLDVLLQRYCALKEIVRRTAWLDRV